jgi:hypothetical protein
MAKHSMKSSGGTGVNGTSVSRTSRTSPSSAGGNALKSDHHIGDDRQGVGSGTQHAKHLVTRPSNDSGSVGKGQPLKTSAAKVYEPTLKSGVGTHKVTKPKR